MSETGVASDLPLPRWALWLMVPGILAPMFIFGFIVVTQLAHDPARCPYRELSRRALGPGVVVVEETRRCLPRVEERRYSLERASRMQVLGSRRLGSGAFADGSGYSWKATEVGGQVKVVIHNEGYGELTFREGTEQERADRKGPLEPGPEARGTTQPVQPAAPISAPR